MDELPEDIDLDGYQGFVQANYIINNKLRQSRVIKVNIEGTERSKLRVTEQAGSLNEQRKNLYYDIDKETKFEEKLNVLDFCEEENIEVISADFKVKQDVAGILANQIEAQQSYFNFSSDKKMEQKRKTEEQELQKRRREEVS